VIRLSSVEIIQVDKITWTSGSPLHRPKVLKRAYRNRHVGHLDVDRPRAKIGVRQNSLQALDHVQVAELCSDQRSSAAPQQRRNGTLREAHEKLVKRGPAQRARRAASRNSNSLRVNKIVSSRFTTSARCPSARNRSRRTRSPSGSCECCSDCSGIDPTLPSRLIQNQTRGRPCSSNNGLPLGKTEREGFEPSNEVSPVTRFPVAPVQPLRHLSKGASSPAPSPATAPSRLRYQRPTRLVGFRAWSSPPAKPSSTPSV
jgi:hypothetical protein